MLNESEWSPSCHRRAGAGPCLVEVAGGAHEPNVGERLREVTELLARGPIDLFGQETQVVGEHRDLFEERLCPFELANVSEGADAPETADRERSVFTGEPAAAAVPVHESALVAEPTCDRLDCRSQARIVALEEAGRAEQQARRVERGGTERLRVGADILVPAFLFDRGAYLVPTLLPTEDSRLGAQLRPDLDRGRFNDRLSMNGTGIAQHDIVLHDFEPGVACGHIERRQHRRGRDPDRRAHSVIATRPTPRRRVEARAP